MTEVLHPLFLHALIITVNCLLSFLSSSTNAIPHFSFCSYIILGGSFDDFSGVCGGGGRGKGKRRLGRRLRVTK